MRIRMLRDATIFPPTPTPCPPSPHSCLLPSLLIPGICFPPAAQFSDKTCQALSLLFPCLSEQKSGFCKWWAYREMIHLTVTVLPQCFFFFFTLSYSSSQPLDTFYSLLSWSFLFLNTQLIPFSRVLKHNLTVLEYLDGNCLRSQLVHSLVLSPPPVPHSSEL